MLYSFARPLDIKYSSDILTDGVVSAVKITVDPLVDIIIFALSRAVLSASADGVKNIAS